MSFRRAHSNFVNLGRLYSIPPWGTVPPYGLVKPQHNFVNLGNLYARSESKYPPGWAYFDDGSVFILPSGWCSHGAFEARMRIAAHFVSGPTPKMQQIRAKNPHMRRLIVINKDGSKTRENTLRILARNAQDGQRVSVVNPPFENVELTLDPSGTRPTSARFSDAPQLRYEHRLRNTEALKTFRGTLIDGILQPNVRLGNGLRLSTKPEILKPQVTEKRRARNHEANRLRESVHLPSKGPAKPLHRADVPVLRERTQSARLGKSTPRKHSRDHHLERREAQIAQRERELIRLQQELLARTMHAQNTILGQDQSGQQMHEAVDAVPDSRIAEIEARERALEQKEELLRYKRKVWLLEQKLAQASAHAPPRRRVGRPNTNVQEHDENVRDESGPGHQIVSDIQHNDSSAEEHSDYSINNTPPTKALKNLRSRIQLPTRETMRSNGEPRHR